MKLSQTKTAVKNGTITQSAVNRYKSGKSEIPNEVLLWNADFFNDIQIVGTYIDRALSAKTFNRQQFQQKIKDSYRVGFDSAHCKATLKKNGVRVISATEIVSEHKTGETP